MSFVKVTYSEFSKLINSRGWWIVFGLVIVLQPLLGLLEADQLLSIGLDATPATHPDLLEAMPPLDYFGFDAALFGVLPIVIWGGISGANEYKNHNLRTTMLYSNKRKELFNAKLLTILISTISISFISIFITVAITHVRLGSLGLNPFILSQTTWKFIGYTTLNWIVPLIFLVPQIYNLGSYLAEKWPWGEYLPVAAGNFIVATPVKSYPHDPAKGTLILLLWIFFLC